ncbi:DUF1624 domain-containing protein, partial [Candidatus Micrarchaeota archaeon]|nr:DUF1624 domain-containing protein [Candidatus Micrarchaeota archaeon]
GPFWFWFALTTASLFLLLSGVSLVLSRSRSEKRGASFLKYLKRGLLIFSLGMLITFVTWLFIGSDFVLFGVLHLIGLSVILSYPLVKNKNASLVAGFLLILAGVVLQGMRFGFSWLVWLGLKPVGYHSVDYFPLLPWLGVVLVGVFLGNVLLKNYGRTFASVAGQNRAARFLSFFGRHSLVIYLLHQPVIILAFSAAGLIKFPVPSILF